MAFVWYDAIRSSKKSTQNNIHFEKAALLFNLGACASQQGLAADRTTSEGLKQACQMFQVRTCMYRPGHCCGAAPNLVSTPAVLKGVQTTGMTVQPAGSWHVGVCCGTGQYAQQLAGSCD